MVFFIGCFLVITITTHYNVNINKKRGNMQVTIYIPRKYEADYEEAKKAAKDATETGGVGAYLMELHKEEEKRNKMKADNVWKKMELRQFDREQSNE